MAFFVHREFKEHFVYVLISFSLISLSGCHPSKSHDWYCCSSKFPCKEGHGDCDKDDECLPGLKCGFNNCRAMHNNNKKIHLGMDCCVKPPTVLKLQFKTRNVKNGSTNDEMNLKLCQGKKCCSFKKGKGKPLSQGKTDTFEAKCGNFILNPKEKLKIYITKIGHDCWIGQNIYVQSGSTSFICKIPIFYFGDHGNAKMNVSCTYQSLKG